MSWKQKAIGAALAIIGSTGYSAGLSDGGFLQAGVYYYTLDLVDKQTDANDNTQKVSRTFLNLTAGYSMASGLLLGLKYLSLTTKSGASGEVQQKVTGAGLGIGFFSDGLYVMVSTMALIAPEWELTGGTTEQTYSDGSGLVLDLAYLLDVGGWFLGPQITWQSLEYTKLKVDGQVDTDFIKRTATEIQPYLAFLVLF